MEAEAGRRFEDSICRICEEHMMAGGDADAVPSSSVFVDRAHPLRQLRAVSQLYVDEHFCDVTLCAGNDEIKCHRNILAASSPFFMAMFRSELDESRQSKVPIKEMEASTLLLVLDYVYTGKVELSVDNVQNVLSAANLFQMIALREGCASFMMHHISVDNCVGVYFFARAHECHDLAESARQLINAEFAAVCREPEFTSLPADKLVDIISDDQICIADEKAVFEVCMRWLEHSPEDRRRDLYSVIKCVRFANIEPYYFCDSVNYNAALRGCEELNQVFDAVRSYHMLPNRHSEMDLNEVPRNGMEYERGIVVLANPYSEDASRKFNSVEVVFPRTGTVKYLCKLPQSVFMPGTCVTGSNQVFVAGGSIRKLGRVNGRQVTIPECVSADVWTLNVNQRTWEQRTSMSRARCQFSMIVVDGAIYVVGGRNDSAFLDHVEKYDLTFCTWSTVAPLPKSLRCTTAVSYRGNLYVFGGESATAIVDTAYKYDPVTNAWTELQPMSRCRVLACSVVYQNKIYVMGGNSSVTLKWKKDFLPEICTSSVEVYDPATNSWSPGPELANALCGAGAVKYGESIMLVGGEDDKSWMAGMYTLSNEDGTLSWVAGQELPMVMSTFGCVIANIRKDLFADNSD